jgi:hypothetical protein
VLPAEAVIVAAGRWLDLLGRSPFVQAQAVLRNDSAFTDLSVTQYAAALEWLQALTLVIGGQEGWPNLASDISCLPSGTRVKIALQRGLEMDDPAWLRDGDLLISEAAELPTDIARASELLGLSDAEALGVVRAAFGKVDTEERARVGALGEQLFVETLERTWPGSTHQVSLSSDGFGYDIAFRPAETEWHLEVKSTTRRGRLAIHVSRNEYEVSTRDRNWKLVVVALGGTEGIAAFGTVVEGVLQTRVPRDLTVRGRWEAARLDLALSDVKGGLPFIETLASESPAATGVVDDAVLPDWFPRP